MLKKFKVTKETLAKSVAATNNGEIDVCAIAMAMKKDYPNVTVGPDGATLDKTSEDSPFVPFPEKVTKYVEAFDGASDEERLKLPDLEFELDVPEGWTKGHARAHYHE